MSRPLKIKSEAEETLSSDWVKKFVIFPADQGFGGETSNANLESDPIIVEGCLFRLQLCRTNT